MLYLTFTGRTRIPDRWSWEHQYDKWHEDNSEYLDKWSDKLWDLINDALGRAKIVDGGGHKVEHIMDILHEDNGFDEDIVSAYGIDEMVSLVQELYGGSKEKSRGRRR